jgi:hypothetical protein
MTPDVAPNASEHHLQLFDSSKSLAETIGVYLLAAFQRGDALLIVVTPQHRELLTRRLEESGLNVRDAIAARRLVMLDAAQLLDKLMRQGAPNPVAFDEVVGTVITQLAEDRRVSIYGEMVDVLASRGNYKGAHQLEELWNRLGRRESFTLFCGYASGHFGDPKTAACLNAICAAHGHVHRKKEDLLAEFLLDQSALMSVRTDAVRS